MYIYTHTQMHSVWGVGNRGILPQHCIFLNLFAVGMLGVQTPPGALQGWCGFGNLGAVAGISCPHGMWLELVSLEGKPQCLSPSLLFKYSLGCCPSAGDASLSSVCVQGLGCAMGQPKV